MRSTASWRARRFIGGPEVTGLEEEVARYSQCPHAIGCASGTDALLLVAAGRSASAPATRSITSAYSFFASAGTIANAGATPVFVDIDPRTYNLDPHRLEAAITPRTKAVVAGPPLRPVLRPHGGQGGLRQAPAAG